MSVEDKSKFLHDVHKNDPVSLKNYVNKTVLIKTKDNREHVGVVYTIDPVSESIILINSSNEEYKMNMIMGHAIDRIEISSESETAIPELFLSSLNKLPESLVLRRKTAVIELLMDNRFPVTENNDVLNIQGIVSIEPPYDQEHCISNNEIVLLRIQQLVSTIVV